MVKIVGANRGSVQSMGRQENLPKYKNFTGEKVGAIVNALDEAGQILSKRTKQKADLFMQKQESSFWKKYGGREFFDVSELPDDIVTEGMKVEGKIASSRVIPEMYNAMVNSGMSEASKMIFLPNDRTEWREEKSKLASAKMDNLNINAAQRLEKQILEDQFFNYDNAREARQVDLQREIVKGMNTDKTTKDKLLLQADQDSEIIKYENSISEGDIESMKGSLEELSKRYDSYKGSGGNLDSTRKLLWQQKLNREIGRLKGESAAVSKYWKEQVRYRLKTNSDNMAKGLRSSPETLSNLKKDLVVLNESTKGEFTQELLELDDQINESVVFDELNLMSRDKRSSSIESIETKNNKGIKETKINRLKRGLRSANDSFTSLENKDAMKAWNQAGAFGPKGMSDVSMELLSVDPRVWANNLRTRNAQFETQQQNYGLGLGQGMLTSREAEVHSALFNSLSPTKQMVILEATVSGLGDKSNLYFKQITAKGEARTFSRAGAALVGGNKQGANVLLEGMKYRKDNFDEVKEIKKNVDFQIQSSLGNSYVNQPANRAAIKDAIFDAYIGLKKNEGPSGFLTLDQDAYDKAVNISTGGLFEHGGKTLPVPVYGMSSDDMDTWIRTTDLRYIERTSGKPFGQETKKFWDDFQDGNYTLEQSVKSGEYIVLNNDGIPLEKQEGGLYTIIYDAMSEKIEGRGNFPSEKERLRDEFVRNEKLKR